MTRIEIARLHPDAMLPTRGTPGSAAVDLYACIVAETGKKQSALVSSQDIKPIPTGWSIRCDRPVFVLSRSGMAAKQRLFVANAPGLIDPDYRGEIRILLANIGHTLQYVLHGDRIAQMLPADGSSFEVVEVDRILPDTDRGALGCGSTGR